MKQFNKVVVIGRFLKSRPFYCLVVSLLVGFTLLKMSSRKSKTIEVELKKPEATPTIAKVGPDLPDYTIPKEVTPASANAKPDEKTALTKENSQYLRSIMQRATENIIIKKNPDGSNTAFLNGTFQSVSAAKRLPDGTLVTRCFESFDALEKFLDPGSTESR